MKYRGLLGICCIGILFVGPASAWESHRADLEEAFLLWATPRNEYGSKAQEEAYALLTTDTAASARVLPRFLGTPSGSIRDKILTFCENAGPAAVGPAFRPHAVSDSPHLGLVLFCLSRAHDSGSLPILLEQLKNRRWQMRTATALSLGYLGHSGAQDSLIRAMETETHPMVRKSLAFALGQCAAATTVMDRSIVELIEALDDDFFATRYNAARALSRLGEPACQMLNAKYDSLSDTGRYGALQVFGRASCGMSRSVLWKTAADPSAPLPLRGVAAKGLLDQKWIPADTDLADLRATSIGRGVWGVIR